MRDAMGTFNWLRRRPAEVPAGGAPRPRGVGDRIGETLTIVSAHLREGKSSAAYTVYCERCRKRITHLTWTQVNLLQGCPRCHERTCEVCVPGRRCANNPMTEAREHSALRRSLTSTRPRGPVSLSELARRIDPEGRLPAHVVEREIFRLLF
jgi:hypothetical protein